MGTEVTSLVGLDPAKVSSNHDTLIQRIQELFPTTELKRGVVHDLVLNLAAILTTANQVTIDNNILANSIKAITENPDLADSTQVDRVLSNFQVTRKTPTSSTGTVTVTLSALVPVTIAKGATFTTSTGLVFASNDVYNARINSASVLNANDRLLTAVSNGFAFTFNVTAAAVGSKYQLQKDTALTPTQAPPNFISAYAESTFTGGTDPEANSDFIARLASGAAVKAWSNRVSNKGLILNQPAFSNIIDISEVGFGDQEMLRYHSIFPIAFGGRSDIYVRTQALPVITSLTKTATLVAKTGAVGTWQFSISADDAPGFYDVVKVTQVGAIITAASYTVTSDVRAFNSAATSGYVPDIVTALEATYSRYSTAAIRFTDTDIDATSLVVNTATRQYAVNLRAMPLISALQTFVIDRTVRPVAADTLVKAAVPCFVSVGFKLNKRTADATPNTAGLQAAVAAAVNKLGFTGLLTSSVISKAVYDALNSTTITASDISLLGKIRKADATLSVITGASLSVPNDPLNMVSSRTVSFILDPTDVAITVVNIDS